MGLEGTDSPPPSDTCDTTAALGLFLRKPLTHESKATKLLRQLQFMTYKKMRELDLPRFKEDREWRSLCCEALPNERV